MPELKERLETLASEGEPRGAAEVMHRARAAFEAGDRRAGGHRVLVSALAAVAAIAILVGTVVALRQSDSGPSVVADGEEEVRGASTPDGGQTLYLVPTVIPEGFEFVRAEGGGQLLKSAGSGSFGSHWIRRYVRFDAERQRPIEILDLKWGGAGGFMPPVSRSPDLTPVTVRGHDGLYSPAYGMLTWEEQVGQTVSISGVTVPDAPAGSAPTATSREFLQLAAETLVPTEAGAFELSALPAGFDLVAEAPGEFSSGVNPRTLAYEAPEERRFEVHLVDDNEVPPALSAQFPTGRLVQVRGQEGVLSTYPPAPGSDGTDVSLMWVERESVTVTVRAAGLSETQVLAVAGGLEAVDTKTWFALQPAPPDPPATTEPLPENEEVPPPTTSGPPPQDEDAAREEITRVFDEFGAIATIDDALAKLHLIDDPTGLEQAIEELARSYPDEVANDSYRVADVRFLSATEAIVTYDILVRGQVSFGGRVGRAVLVDDTWRITRGTVCSDYALAGVHCPGSTFRPHTRRGRTAR